VKRAPAIQTTGTVLNYRVAAVDKLAVWITGYRSAEAFLARFDRHTHEWKGIPTDEDVPILLSRGTRLVADGESCWLLAGNDTYRLGMQTNRWENMSRRVGDGKNRVVFKQAVADDDDVWLVASTTNVDGSPLEHPPAAPLYRYHKKINVLAPVQPSPGQRLLIRDCSVNKESVLVAADQGVYRLDRPTKRWSALHAPDLPAGFPSLDTHRAAEDTNDVWFIGMNDALRVRK
jgi:hypothetical protein